ncbi:MAG: hypothetical protein JWO48_3843, partial [Bryobacterales bacterium]|nr:hypothetical protein [Bryobacterales bacterium]
FIRGNWNLIVAITSVVAAFTAVSFVSVRLMANRGRAIAEKDQRERELAWAQDADRVLREAGRAFRQRCDVLLMKYDRMLIDANIWMERDYHSALRLFAEAAQCAGRPIRLIGAEFEEIIRLKDTADGERASKARAALHLIEELQTAGHLHIERVALRNVRAAYYDGVVLQMAQADTAAGRNVTVITDDAEFRVRLRSRIAGSNGSLQVLEGREFGLGNPGGGSYDAGFREAGAQKPPGIVAGEVSHVIESARQ